MKPISVILKSIKTKNELLDIDFIDLHYNQFVISEILYKEKDYISLCKHLNDKEISNYTHYLLFFNLGAKITKFKKTKKYQNTGTWEKFISLKQNKLSFREYLIHSKYNMTERY